LNGADAEFGWEDTEELSSVQTRFPRDLVRKLFGRDEPGPALASPKGAVERPAAGAGSAKTRERDKDGRSLLQEDVIKGVPEVSVSA